MACPETGEVRVTNAIASTANVMIAAFSVATDEARTSGGRLIRIAGRMECPHHRAMAVCSVAAELSLHPNRLLPPDPAVPDTPAISPHGHVDARRLLDDEPFPHRRSRAAAHHPRRRWRAEGVRGP
jgi:hypothetical protein